MKDDLIKRQDVIEACRSVADNINSPTDQQIGAEYCLDLINEIPSAEPERKKGKWVDGLPYVNSHWWVCSICHVSAPENHTGYKFCPNCGAEMVRGDR